ncbi:MAG: hypothetical protein COW01_05335 [Bdellovibrionales bacterium CG12_big_fil_rev_8_21_14_0_65_38_15]|nr:MAG: hypothetical protein COW79_00825 [Bdellovibrionales bacterium CG22_combo_CG10-13_8_21_14_all_38_13]PIQ56174.1 MAG: hypothetical protein COW01_05335 [Bdellovibrionales bacterium CG12_big_fil_rev_8_21_14_0_65_38_15]
MLGALVNQRGFSLVSVMVAAGLVGGLALAVMQITKNSQTGLKFAESISDEIDLRENIKAIVSNPSFCRLSIAGNGAEGSPSSPVIFKKNLNDQDNEGLDIEFFLGNQLGTARTTKKYSGSDSSANTYNGLTIKSIKLIFDNGTGFNYSTSSFHQDIAKIRLVFEKKYDKAIREKQMDFQTTVSMQTDVLGNSTLLGCNLTPANAPAGAPLNIIAIHSQTSSPPGCPADWDLLWSGYSFFTAIGGQSSNARADLGSPGSCLETFKHQPMIECTTSTCDYHTSNDFSYWLTNTNANTGTINGSSAMGYISRCSVCAAKIQTLTRHSFSGATPVCPAGWSSLWVGYTFMTGVGGLGSNANQDLASTGSCLKLFRPMPFAECEGPGIGNCDVATGDDFAYWGTNRSVDESPVPANTATSKLSRCNVCSLGY